MSHKRQPKEPKEPKEPKPTAAPTPSAPVPVSPSAAAQYSPKIGPASVPALSVPVPAPAVVYTQSIRRDPKPLNAFKRIWIWYESSFAISMLETWEKVFLHTFALALLSLFYYACSRYLPGQIERVAGRVKFYLFGLEDLLYA